MLSFAHSTHVFFFILLLHFHVFSCHQVCNHHDQSALLAFSANISTSRPWLPLNWLGVNCCQWEGVECDLNGRVTHLQLPSKSLQGVINIYSLSNLTMLTHLNLSNNYLHGSLGDDIIRLTNLRIIDLSLNSLIGSIPQEIGKLLSLEKLHLYNNNLSGPIPSSLMNCTRIAEIILRYNNLNGDISTLDFSNLVQLQKIDLKANSLSGILSESIYLCKSLTAIRLSNNNISGLISPKITQLESLSFLSLAGTYLTNITMTLRILAKCKNLTSLFLSANFNNESLPTNIDFINIGEFTKLQFFSLANCNFEPGPIPNWLSTLKSLCVLSLENNRLTGHVPYCLGTLPNLFVAGLSGNSLYGEIPINFWQLPALISEDQTDLNLSVFELPVFLDYGISLKFKSIRFKANYYRGFFLSSNAFSGKIPEEIGSLQNIQHLYLDNNRFYGQIPTSISNLHKLERLDLSINNLTGVIPTSLTSLSFLSHFNVSYNDLCGLIPTGGQFDSFEESEFEGNPSLCGKPLKLPCYGRPPTSKEMDTIGSHDNNKKQFLDGLLVGFASGFFIILIAVVSYFCYHKVKEPTIAQDFSTLIDTQRTNMQLYKDFYRRSL